MCCIGSYVKNNRGYIHRSDLSGQAQNDYESLWIEIQSDDGRNTICEVFNRHPHGNLDNVLDHINMIVKKIYRQNRYCFDWKIST